jgi:peptide/nickel transport system permease protein
MSLQLAATQSFSSIPWRRIVGAFGLGVLFLLALMAILHDAVAPYGLGFAMPANALAPPGQANPFGVDFLGRDVFSETIHALNFSMAAAGIGFAFALVFGALAGLFAAHLLGRAGTLLRVAVGVAAAVPVLLLAILFVVLIGHASAAIAAGLAAAPAQFVRSFDRTRHLLSGRQAEFARSSGVTPIALLKRDVTHEFLATLVVMAARAFAAVTITLATMSFFGFGAAPPARDLGLMIASGRIALDTAWWAAAFPAGALVLLVLAAHLAAGVSADERP